MNKFICIALALCVAVASASPVPEINDEPSQLALFESDDVETAGLGQEKAIFHDYCISARDDIKQYLKQSVNDGAAQVFNFMIDTVSKVTGAVGEASGHAISEGTERVSGNALEMKSAFAGVLATGGQTAADQVKHIIAEAKEQLNTDNLKEAAEKVCVYVAMQLKPRMEKRLAEFKKETLKTPAGEEYKALFSKTRFENVGCVTTSRISKIVSGCNMIRLVGPSLADFLGH